MVRAESLLTPAKMIRRVARAERVLWFVDFDGTLVRIVRDPDKVVLTAAVREALAGLSGRGDTRVAVVSGRPLSFVRRRVGLPAVTFAGNHGLEVAGPGLRFRHPGAVAARPGLLEAKKAWAALLPRFPGGLVEDKGMSVTFHYRQVVPALQEKARRGALSAVKIIVDDGLLKITKGKKVVEVRPPVAWGKGDVLKYLLDRWGYRRGADLVVALGDDETDRDMFAPVRSSGLAVFVGRGTAPPEATGRLRGPAAVRDFLRRAAGLPG
jgi:trehalose-phosphatase